MTETLIIFRKELKEVLRDRKTLIFMLAMPMFLVPLLLDFGIQFALDSAKKEASKTLVYAVVGQDHLPEVAREFASKPGFELAPEGSVGDGSPEALTGAVRDGAVDFALLIVAPEGERDGAGPQTKVYLYYDDASSTSRAEDRATAVIEALGEAERRERLEALGVAAHSQSRLLEPISVMSVKTADTRAVMGEIVGGMLPYIFIIFCFMGALYPSIDLGAGEKERGTLETLLLVPVNRRQIVLGKYLVVFTAGATSAVLSLTSLGVWLATRGQSIAGDLGGSLEIGKIIQSIGTLDLVLIAAMLIPTAAIFAALLLSISIYAKSFKEAQSYAAPLNVLIILPAVVAMLPGVELDWTWAMVPITNISLAVKELIKGTMNYEMMIAILGSSVILAGALLAFCTWWFRRESVLFRQ